MRHSEAQAWITKAISSLSPSSHQLIQEDASRLANTYFKDPSQNRIAGNLFFQLGLGARLHWENLNRRQLVPKNVSFPTYVIGKYPGTSLSYDSKARAISVDHDWFLSCVAIGDPNRILRWASIYGTNSKRMPSNVFFFLAGIEELDHAVKDRKFGLKFLPGFAKSETKFYASNHEYTSLGWMIYYAYVFSLPELVTERLEDLMDKAIKYRKVHHEEKELRLIPIHPTSTQKRKRL